MGENGDVLGTAYNWFITHIFAPKGHHQLHRCMLPSITPWSLPGEGPWQEQGLFSCPYFLSDSARTVLGVKVWVGDLPFDCTISSLTWKNMIIFMDLDNCTCKRMINYHPIIR